MCEICLEGRKVFLSEQQLYSRADLERHQAGVPSADAGNALGEASFKGRGDIISVRIFCIPMIVAETVNINM
jgi:hypothetical protein